MIKKSLTYLLQPRTENIKKFNLLSSSLISISLLFCSTNGHTNTVNQTVTNSQQYNKNLVNEWVQYKFIYAELEQQGAAMQEQIIQQLGTKTKTGGSNSPEQQINKLVALGKQKFESIQPQTVEVKKLLKLQTENVEMMAKVMPNHFKLMSDKENTKIDTNAHFEQFMKFSATTAAANSYDLEVEKLVMQYLKDNPLK